MAHTHPFESAPEGTCPRLRVVFGGMDGRFSTTPLLALARRHHLVGVVHAPPRRVSQGLLLDYARAGAHRGNLKRFASFLGSPFLALGRGSVAGLPAFLRRTGADLLCLANFPALVPAEVFNAPRLGTVNLHSSLLPRHRGPNPWLWMFHDGDPRAGFTAHQVDEGEDTGPILGVWEHEVPLGITASELADRVLPQAAGLLVEVVDALAAGVLTPRPQASAEGLRRARFVLPGEALIDWGTWSAARVSAFLRGASLWHEPFPPLPGFAREYGAPLPGDPGGGPGALHQGIRGGWIACRDGRVPFRLRPIPRELWRMAAPLALGGGLWALA